MHALCLQHVPFEGPGVFARLLAERGVRVITRLVPEEGLPDSPGDLLLVMGGPMSVNDSEAWLSAETVFIGDALRAGTAVIGVCLGSQLMARALGAAVGPGIEPEIGMTTISLTAEGRRDPVFGEAGPTLKVFEWHGEVFDQPPGTVSLASSTHCGTQAFRLGARAYGLLFHLEMERAGIEALCHACPGDLARAGLSPGAVLSAADAHLPRLHRLAARLLDRLVTPAR